MKPVTQTKRGGNDAAPEDRGDCFDACLASVLEVPIEAVHVPHDEEWWQHAIDVVAAQGHRLLPVYNPDAVPEGEKYTAAMIGEWLGDVYWLACVPSHSLAGERHVIVMRGPDVAHDPGLGERLYTAGPLADDVEVFDAMLLVPLADVGRPMVAAALARPGWRPRLAHVEHLLSTYVAAVEVGDRDAEMGNPDGDVVQALAEVRALIDGDPAKIAEPWQRKLSVIEAKLREVQRDVEVKSMLYSVEVLDEVLAELRALIDA
jgi:hypothetical protein